MVTCSTRTRRGIRGSGFHNPWPATTPTYLVGAIKAAGPALGSPLRLAPVYPHEECQLCLSSRLALRLVGDQACTPTPPCLPGTHPLERRSLYHLPRLGPHAACRPSCPLALLPAQGCSCPPPQSHRCAVLSVEISPVDDDDARYVWRL